MKESSLMLTLLIPSRKSPGKDIDVYLRPLIDDLKDLWAKPDVETIDVATCKKFNMRTGKHSRFRGVKIKRNVLVELNWTKRSMFYELEYWSFVTLKHNLDVIHIKKNVLESFLNTLLMNDKSKDTAKARQDLERLGIRSALWLGKNKNEKCSKPQAAYSFTPKDKKSFVSSSKELTYQMGPIFGGPIHPWWMYPFERYIKKLKNHVRNKANPEGSIAKGYVAEEALTFSSHYFRDVTIKFNRLDRNVDFPPTTCQFQVFKSLCKSIDLRSVIRIDYKELKKVTCRDERHTTQNSGICSPGSDGEMYYGQLEQILEFSYLWGFSVVEDDPNVIHVDKSSNLALCTSLNDSVIAALHIYGQSIDVDAPPDVIDVVDEDDDIIDKGYPVPHDLADSTDEDLVNIDIDDGVNMSADVAWGHSGEGGGDDRHPSYEIPTGCGGCLGNRCKGTRKPNLGGRRAGRLYTHKETQNLGLKAIMDKSGLVSIRFEFGNKETLMPLGDHAAHWANYLGELTQFHLRPHKESDHWPQIHTAIQQHLQKLYNGKKAALKERHWVPEEDGTYDMEHIRRGRPTYIFEADWDAQIAF
uniref:DUF4218 domain-containing protein n=1 Tax=Tanacetum cinerariifolium TaxID=118510 RepID=A0A699GTQ2_TANCI|nr:hypothetical protein [Tanacetum cinerariifolium]